MKNLNMKKYYTCMIVAILIIAISVSLGTYKLKLENMPSFVKSDEDNIKEIEQMIEDEEEEKIEGETEPEVNPTVKKYTKATAFQCVTDAIKQVENSKGYRAIFQTDCIVYAAGIEFARQEATEEVINSGKYHLTKTIASSESSFGENYYRYFYSEDDLKTVEFKRTRKFSNGIPDWSGTDIDIKVPLNEITSKYDRFPCVLFTVLPTKKSALTSFDKMSNSKYYIIKFAVSSNEISDAYKENIKWQGELESVTIKTMSFSFYIEKATLNLRKVERRETYEATRSSGLSGDCDLTTTISFPTLNKELVPVRPLEHF